MTTARKLVGLSVLGVAGVVVAIAASATVAVGSFSVTVVSQTKNTQTLGWQSPGSDLAGYLFTVDGARSNTWDPLRTTVRVSRSAKSVKVDALVVSASGSWPSGGTTTTTTTTTPIPPGAKTATPATLAATLADLRSGDILVLEDGTYAPFSLNVANVIVVARNKWKAVVDGNYAAENGIVFGSSAHDDVIDGLQVQRLTTKGGSVSGIELYNGGAGSVIRNTNIHDIGNDKTSGVSTGQNGIFVEVNNVTVQDNFIHNIGRTNFDNHDHGIYADGARGLNGLKVLRNFFRDIYSGWGVQLYPGNINGVEIGNNTFVNGTEIRLDSNIVISAVFGGGDIHDNLFWSSKSPSAALYLDNVSGSDLRVRNNRYTQTSLFNVPPPSTIVAENNTKVSVPKPPDPTP